MQAGRQAFQLEACLNRVFLPKSIDKIRFARHFPPRFSGRDIFYLVGKITTVNR